MPTNNTTVYVRLLNEGTTVLRPVSSIETGSNRFRLLTPADYDPEDEEWEFLPGSIVICEQQQFEGEKVFVAKCSAG